MNQATKLETKNNLTPMELINIVVQKGSGLDQLGQLMQLHQDYERYESEKAFNNSMAMFQADPPEIFKNTHVEYGTTKYDHASLDHVVEQIREKMKPLSLMFTWNVEALDDGDQRVTCIIRHNLGHSTSTAIKAPPDKSGQKNTVQSIASTITYLQRYTLLAATGCAPKHLTPDNDGRPLNDGRPPAGSLTAIINEARIEEATFFKDLRSLLKKAKLRVNKFCDPYGITKVEDLPRSEWKGAIKKLNDRVKIVERKSSAK